MSAQDIAVLLTAIAGVLAVVWQGFKTRAEVDAIRATLEPNSGSSVADAVRRIDKRVAELSRSVGSIRDDARADRAALDTLHRDVLTIRDHHHDRLANLERKIK